MEFRGRSIVIYGGAERKSGGEEGEDQVRKYTKEKYTNRG